MPYCSQSHAIKTADISGKETVTFFAWIEARDDVHTAVSLSSDFIEHKYEGNLAESYHRGELSTDNII